MSARASLFFSFSVLFFRSTFVVCCKEWDYKVTSFFQVVKRANTAMIKREKLSARIAQTEWKVPSVWSAHHVWLSWWTTNMKISATTVHHNPCGYMGTMDFENRSTSKCVSRKRRWDLDVRTRTTRPASVFNIRTKRKKLTDKLNRLRPFTILFVTASTNVINQSNRHLHVKRGKNDDSLFLSQPMLRTCLWEHKHIINRRTSTKKCLPVSALYSHTIIHYVSMRPSSWQESTIFRKIFPSRDEQRHRLSFFPVLSRRTNKSNCQLLLVLIPCDSLLTRRIIGNNKQLITCYNIYRP